jgi:mannitol/fructose-specific phosphotransferase system IIA component (Ntr-type)
MKSNVADTPRFSDFVGSRGCWILDGPASGGARDKWDVIARMLDLLIEAGRVAREQRDAILTLLLERERSMSTGLECGIALPHAAVEGLGQLVAGIAVFRQGVPFQSIDGGPARIVVLLLIPKERRMAYLPVLAEAARLLSRDSVREQLLAQAASSAPGPAELLPIIRAAEGSAESGRG